MKKIIAAIMSFCIIGGAIPAVYSGEPETSVAFADAVDPTENIGKPLEDYPERLLGDVDNDGYITAYDSSEILKICAVLNKTLHKSISELYDPEILAAADSKSDSRITTIDAAYVALYYASACGTPDSDYARSIISGHNNTVIPYDNSSYINSANYVEPDDAEVKPKIYISSERIGGGGWGSSFGSRDVYVSVYVSGCSEKYSALGLNIIYDDRLELVNGEKDIKQGAAISDYSIFSKKIIDKGHINVLTADYENSNTDGELLNIHFRLPEDASAGDIYPIGIEYLENEHTYDCFGSIEDREGSKKMQSYLFTEGITNGYIELYEELTVEGGHLDIDKEVFIEPGGKAKLKLQHNYSLVYEIENGDYFDLEEDTFAGTATISCAEDTPPGDYRLEAGLRGAPGFGSYGNTECIIHVVEPPTTSSETSESTQPHSDLQLSAEELFLKPGEQYTITANQSGMQYSSNNPNAAIVSGKGVITALKTGEAIITVYNSNYDTAQIRVVVGKLHPGDANGDGNVDMSDVVMVMQACLNPKKYGVDGTSPDRITADGEKAGDVDGNAGLSANDALIIQRYSLKLIDKL